MSKDNAVQVFNHPQLGSSNTIETKNGESLMRTRWKRQGRMLIYKQLKRDGVLPIIEMGLSFTEN